jgi:AcrR family transcriptional regulator
MPKTATGRPRKVAKVQPPKASEQPPQDRQPVRTNAGFTGMNIPEETAQKIAALHLAGVPVTRIAKELGVSYHTITALVRNRPELLEAARDVTAKNWKTLAALGTAELVDRLPEMKDQALSVLAAIATEKSELLAGGATSRIEVVSAPSADEWLDVVDGVVVESGPLPTGITGQTRATKAHNRTQAPRLEAPDGEQPPALECSVSVDAAGVSTFEPDEARFLPPPPPGQVGGDGVRRSSRPTYPDSTDDQKFFEKR